MIICINVLDIDRNADGAGMGQESKTLILREFIKNEENEDGLFLVFTVHCQNLNEKKCQWSKFQVVNTNIL